MPLLIEFSVCSRKSWVLQHHKQYGSACMPAIQIFEMITKNVNFIMVEPVPAEQVHE